MKKLFVHCFVSKIKHLSKKYLCISIQTTYSDDNLQKSKYDQNNTALSFRNNKQLGIIYEDIEYKNLKDH